MECWNCGAQLIWGGDHDIAEESEDYLIETNLHCPNCQTEVLVYTPKGKLT